MQHFDNQTGQIVENNEFEFVDPGPYNKNSWNNIRSYNYVRIKDGTDIKHLHEKTKQLIAKVKLPEQIRESAIVPD